ncbi:MAG: GNAT family N-acetyltransferase [Oscillospiraceae bacterium]|nr:GNAT family N-acetyltransferase [Oscillospiraceae bacterium]
MIIETDRLYLRELTLADFNDLCKMLQDEEVMYAYEHAFSDDQVRNWLNLQIRRYKKDGIGLWGVIHKETDMMIGQCGLTIQECFGNKVVEIGYIYQKEYWNKGYAVESAKACKVYAFEKLKIKEVYSIIRDTNISSQKVAKKNGMNILGNFIKHYNGMDMAHLVYCVKNNIKSGPK